MGDPIIVVDDPEFKWGFGKVGEVIDNFVHVVEPSISTSLHKSWNVALGVQLFTTGGSAFETYTKSKSLHLLE